MPPALILFIALIGISVSGPLVRLSHAHPVTIAVGRVALSLPIVGLFLLGTGSWRQWRRLDRKALGLALFAGAMLALHFWSWNTSIGLTTVAASVVLVNTQPIIVAALSVVWLREPPTRRHWIGIAIAMIGAAIVASPDLMMNGTEEAPARHALMGDFLALVGAITAAIYYVSGRRLRTTLDLWPYVALVYGACLAVLLAVAWVVHAPVVGQPGRELAIFGALAIGPMLLGHTGLNWALRYLRAYVVNLTLLGEPVLATILAAFLPGIREVPRFAILLGGAIVLAGIYVTTSNSRPRTDDGFKGGGERRMRDGNAFKKSQPREPWS